MRRESKRERARGSEGPVELTFFPRPGGAAARDVNLMVRWGNAETPRRVLKGL